MNYCSHKRILFKFFTIRIKFFLLAFAFVWISLLNCFAQDSSRLSIEECYSLARKQYPLLKQKELIEKSRDYSLENASKGYLPQLSINALGTYQSEVTKVPISLPNMSIPAPSKDQYKLYGEINQPISDAVIIKHQKNLIETNAQVEEQKLEVELYKLKERINQLFFGILLVNEQFFLTELFIKDIRSALDKVNNAILNGVAMKSNSDILKAEILKGEQRIIELKGTKKAYVEMLALFVNLPLGEKTELIKPASKIPPPTINRVEMVLFENQKKTLDIQSKLVLAKNLPRFNLFLQSGYGRPALNMFNPDFDFFYYGGLRINWPITGFYTLKNEQKIIGLSQNLFDIQKETFLFNTNLLLKQQLEEINKLKELIVKDNEIIELRKNIINAAKVQLENGVITATDYLKEMNAADQAAQILSQHQIQLTLAEYNCQTISGN